VSTSHQPVSILPSLSSRFSASSDLKHDLRLLWLHHLHILISKCRVTRAHTTLLYDLAVTSTPRPIPLPFAHCYINFLRLSSQPDFHTHKVVRLPQSAICHCSLTSTFVAQTDKRKDANNLRRWSFASGSPVATKAFAYKSRPIVTSFRS
jgi:hypothetical protein